MITPQTSLASTLSTAVFFDKGLTVNFDIKLLKGYDNTVNLLIRIGKFGNKEASVNLLTNIKSNLGL